VSPAARPGGASAAAAAAAPAPWRFADLVGHARPRAALLRAVCAGQVAHAYLFSGPTGVGKERAAWSLAAALQCAAPAADGDACGACEPCRKVAARLHPDVALVEPDGATIKIEQVREVAARGQFRPHEGNVRVTIFRDAERLGPNAANALLKTLEEPPAASHFVLIVPSIRNVLPTILSRCQMVKFAPLGPEDLAAVVRRVRPGLGEAEAATAAALGQGSAERALAAMDPEASAARRETIELCERAARAKLLQPAFEVAEVFKAAGGDAARREEVARRLEALLTWYRDVLVTQVEAGAGGGVAGGGGVGAPVNSDLGDLLAARAHTLGQTGALAAADAVALAVDAVRKGGNVQLAVEKMLFDIRAAAGTVR
jgi:DNA polymerase-3 subunit delta'